MKQQLYSEDESMRFSWLLILILALPPAVVILTTTDFKPQTSETSCEKVRIFLEETDQIRVSKDSYTLIIGGSVFSEWKRRSAQKLEPSQLRVKASPLFTPTTIAKCFERTVAHYRPVTTVLFLGDSDGLAKSESTFNALDEIDALRAYWSVSPSLVVVPPAITPALKPESKALRDFEQRLTRWVESKPGTSMLDINTLLADDQGEVDPLLFWPDGRTLGKRGCQRLQGALLGYAGVSKPTTEMPADRVSS